MIVRSMFDIFQKEDINQESSLAYRYQYDGTEVGCLIYIMP